MAAPCSSNCSETKCPVTVSKPSKRKFRKIKNCENLLALQEESPNYKSLESFWTYTTIKCFSRANIICIESIRIKEALPLRFDRILYLAFVYLHLNKCNCKIITKKKEFFVSKNSTPKYRSGLDLLVYE